jgi:hypothetical protein
MSLKLSTAYVAVEINDGGAADIVTGEPIPMVTTTYGPFTKAEAQEFAHQYNEEYDGSPWRVIVRPMSRLEVV